MAKSLSFIFAKGDFFCSQCNILIELLPCYFGLYVQKDEAETLVRLAKKSDGNITSRLCNVNIDKQDDDSPASREDYFLPSVNNLANSKKIRSTGPITLTT